jgi:hypothetical protein
MSENKPSIVVSPEDLQMVIKSYQKINENLIQLGISVIKAKEAEASVDQHTKAVAEAQSTFKSFVAVVLAKYGVDPNTKSNLDINTGMVSFE